MKKVSLSMLDKLFAAVSANKTLMLPVDDKTGTASFKVWQEGAKLSEQLNTVKSAKDAFFPQVENLMGFKIEGKSIEKLETREELKPFVFFGVRACDAKSFEILDKVFLQEPVDTFYEERRKNCCVVTLACGRPEETCFCSAFGIDAANPQGDVSCWKDAENLYWQANTPAGEALTAELSEVLSDCADNSADAVKSEITEILNKLPLKKLDLSAFGAGKTAELFKRPEWSALSEGCLGCGTCTFTCPTCQCYDIEEFNDGKTVRRFRCWDSCMYSDFTKMSAGQPRPTQMERFRQRFMHKLVYFPDNNDGCFGCVGCGRCIRKCPIHMNIVKVIKTLGEGEKA